MEDIMRREDGVFVAVAGTTQPDITAAVFPLQLMPCSLFH
jgi:hypothetical protein